VFAQGLPICKVFLINPFLNADKRICTLTVQLHKKSVQLPIFSLYRGVFHGNMEVCMELYKTDVSKDGPIEK
jgi:hypothetical protein